MYRILNSHPCKYEACSICMTAPPSSFCPCQPHPVVLCTSCIGQHTLVNRLEIHPIVLIEALSYWAELDYRENIRERMQKREENDTAESRLAHSQSIYEVPPLPVLLTSLWFKAYLLAILKYSLVLKSSFPTVMSDIRNNVYIGQWNTDNQSHGLGSCISKMEACMKGNSSRMSLVERGV